uniref:Protein JTB n=1 Tax=Panagrolaimus sp. ES5 TaxID=591445 RepID=A0AC34G7G4_9BILA
MIETCTTRRMLILIGFLLVSSCLILLFEEYVEENEFDTSRIIEKVAALSHKHSSSIPKDTQTVSVVPTFVDCNSPGALKLINSCVQCSDFEINALKTAHCQQTGYFDKYLCAATNQSVYLPCHSKTLSTNSKFNYFTIFTLFSSMGFTSFVFWRRSIIEKKAYTRLQNFIG